MIRGHFYKSYRVLLCQYCSRSKANTVCDPETDEALMFLDIDAIPDSEEEQ